MSQKEDKELRGLLAEMPALESELATELAKDVSPEVRGRLAQHARDPEIIATLLEDRTVRVRKGLALNPRTTAEQRKRLAQDSSPDVRAAVVRAVELDEEDLQALVGDRSVEVRRSLATSELTPAHIRTALENDEDESVAEDARNFRPAPVVEKPVAARRMPPRPVGNRFPGR